MTLAAAQPRDREDEEVKSSDPLSRGERLLALLTHLGRCPEDLICSGMVTVGGVSTERLTGVRRCLAQHAA